MSTALLLFIIIIVCVIIKVVWTNSSIIQEQWFDYRRLKHCSSNIPERRCLPLIGQPLRILNFQHVIDNVSKDFEQFGSPFKVFLLGILIVSISDPKQIELVCNSPYAQEKPKQIKFIQKYLCDGLLVASHKRWKITRKMLNSAFHQKILKASISTFDKQGQLLITLLEKEVNQQQSSFNVRKYVSITVTNVIYQTMFCCDGAQNDDGTSFDTYHIISKFLENFLKIALNPLLNTKLFETFSSVKKDFHKAGAQLQQFLLKVLKTNRNILKMKTKTEYETIKPFLARLIEIYETTNDIYTENQVLGEMLSIFIAGVDTTSVAISFMFVTLGIHQDVQTKLYEEIKSVINDDQISYEQINQMPYLDRVVKEVLRLYPPVPMFARQINNDINIGAGHTIPNGTGCIISPYHVHRNPNLWPNPNTFDPDRFLSHQQHPYAYIPFGAGPRKCIGQKFSILLIKTIMARVIHSYEIGCDYKEEEDLKFYLEIVLQLVGGYNIRIRKRNNNNL